MFVSVSFLSCERVNASMMASLSSMVWLREVISYCRELICLSLSRSWRCMVQFWSSTLARSSRHLPSSCKSRLATTLSVLMTVYSSVLAIFYIYRSNRRMTDFQMIFRVPRISERCFHITRGKSSAIWPVSFFTSDETRFGEASYGVRLSCSANVLEHAMVNFGRAISITAGLVYSIAWREDFTVPKSVLRAP
jgi:hypothetical protein